MRQASWPPIGARACASPMALQISITGSNVRRLVTIMIKLAVIFSSTFANQYRREWCETLTPKTTPFTRTPSIYNLQVHPKPFLLSFFTIYNCSKNPFHFLFLQFTIAPKTFSVPLNTLKTRRIFFLQFTSAPKNPFYFLFLQFKIAWKTLSAFFFYNFQLRPKPFLLLVKGVIGGVRNLITEAPTGAGVSLLGIIFGFAVC